ncbi:MAG: hypothetical protein H0X51_02110 [Parachlamydiaceae bacterium]|nr:hypothetical protein [Parachlamydiaceae bacterium]
MKIFYALFAFCCVLTQLSALDVEKNNLLCVLYDAGDTGIMVPVLERLDKEGIDFHVLVMATAETIVKPGMFGKKRITLKDLGIGTVVDTTTARTMGLASSEMKKVNKLNPSVVLVGTASKIQQQVLKEYSDRVTVAFVDNFSYDPCQEAFATVEDVVSVAKNVLYPSDQTRMLFEKVAKGASYIVGKPSLEKWQQDIEAVDQQEVLQHLGFNEEQPIVTLIGGYGPGYEVIDPLFDSFVDFFRKEGFQVIRQHHPKVAPNKVKVTEALAVSQYAVGYNSSVVLDAAILGKKSLFFIPDDPRTSFRHLAIAKGFIPKVTTYDELVKYIRSEGVCLDVRKALNLPEHSTERVVNLLEMWIAMTNCTTDVVVYE